MIRTRPQRSAGFRAGLFIALYIITVLMPSSVTAADSSADPGGSPAPIAAATPAPTSDPTPGATLEPGVEATPWPTSTPTRTPTRTPRLTPTPELATQPYIVTFVSGVPADLQDAILASVGAVETGSIPQLRMRAILLAPSRIESIDALRHDPRIAGVDADRLRIAEALIAEDSTTDPDYGDQWALPQIGWDVAHWTYTAAGTAVVAVLDTGVDDSHPDLDGSIVPGASILDGSTWSSDPNGHGTAMAGIVAAETDNGEGIAGVGYAGVRVMPVTVLGADGTGQDSDIIAGVVWAADSGADVILMAFSSGSYSASLQAALDYAWANGVVLVAAAGNDGSSAGAFPAGDRGVIGVSNTTQDDTLAAGSNFGASVFLGAPGVGILTTNSEGGYRYISGTSASAAVVAGAAGELIAVDPTASNGVVVDRLARNADPAGTQAETGNGRVNLARAAADTGTTEVTPAGVASGADGGPFVGPYVAASAADDCFRTVASGNWNATSTWQSATDVILFGCTSWNAATLTPTSAASTIDIRNGHTATVTANVTVDEVTVDAGGQVTVNSGVTLTLNNGTGTDLTVNGTLDIGPTGIVSGAGLLAIAAGATLKIGSVDGIDTSTTTGNVRTSGTDTYSTTANYEYKGTAAQITGASLPATVNNLTINNTGGNVTLTNAATTVSGALTLTSGDLSTGSGANVLALATAATCNGTTDVVSGAAATGGVSRTTIGVGTMRCFGNPQNRITIASGTAPTAFTVKLVKAAPTAKTGAITRTYTITPTGGSGFAATVRLHYLDAELNGNTESLLHLWSLNGSWSDQNPGGASTTGDTTANWVQQTGIAAFSDWTIADLVNVAPVVTVTVANLAYTENGTTVLDAGITATDVDSANLSSATVTMTTNYVNGEDTLAFVTQNGISGSWTAATGVLALSGSSSVANYQTALRSITYTDNSDTPSTATRTVTFIVNDGTANSNTASRDITITAVNDGPINTVPGAQTIGRDDTLVFVGGAGTVISIADVDAASSSVQAQLIATNGTITLAGTTGLSFSVGDGTADATMTFTGTMSAINTALTASRFIAATSYVGAGNVRIVTGDQGNTGSGGTLTDTDDVAVTITDKGIFLGSVDNGAVGIAGTGSHATGIYTVRASGLDIWGTSDEFHAFYMPLTGDGRITARVVSLGSSDDYAVGGVMMHDGDDRNIITYLTPAHGNRTTYRATTGGTTAGADVGSNVAPYWVRLTRIGSSFHAEMSPDGTTWSDLGTQTITMSATIYVGLIANSRDNAVLNTATFDNVSVTNAPVVTATVADLAYTENGTTILDAGITATDADSANLSSATITMTTNYQNGQDTLAFVNQNGISGTWTPGTGVLALTGSATVANYQVALRTITYNNNSDTPNPATRTVTFVANDATFNSITASRQVTVTAVNDAPSGTNQTVTTYEDTGYAFTTADFGFSDATDGGANTLLAVNLTTLPATGSLTLSGSGVTVGQSVSAANITSGLLSFTPAANATGAANVSFTFQVQDNGGIASGGVDLDPSANTMTIDVTAVNDAPSFTKGGNQTVNNATAQSVSGWATALSAGPADESAQVLDFVISNDNNGLFSAQPAVSATGTLTFTPASGASGYATVTVQIHDNGGTSNGGVNTSAAQTFVITVSDGAYESSSGWSTSFVSSRYLRLTFPAYVPMGSVVTSATFRHEYRSATVGDTTCYYFEVYSGVTLLATHGSTGSPVSCNATGSYASDAVALSEVDTVAEANSLSIKLFVMNSGGRPSQHRTATLGVTSSLD